jgi:SAM-dependent methyltransferase
VNSKKKLLHYRQNSSNFAYSGREELINSELGLTNYSSEITQKFINSLEISKLINPSILEFGAGTGSLALNFYEKTAIRPDCIEIDPELIVFIKQRKFKCFSEIDQLKTEYDGIYTSNVLEHISDELPILISLRNVLKINGKIVIYVPAHQFLFSDMDKSVGHYRRYSRNELMKKVESAGFEVESCDYHDFLGFFALFLVKLLGWNNNFGVGNPKILKFYDKIVFPVSRVFDTLGFRKLLGKNLLLIARR